MQLVVPVVRHMRVISNQSLQPGRHMAFELLLRAAAIAVSTTLILGLLPLVLDSVR
jgi:hypothetical protein